ncbi:MAG: prephenate dehydratase [Solirubrobacteraceae bacterium]
MRLGYFGPEGTFTAEALHAAMPAGEHELVPLPTIHDTVMAVHDGAVEKALVPIENSLEGSVNATLDALASSGESVRMVGETVHPIRHCLIARGALALDDVRRVVSHPQPLGQCAQFIRECLPGADVLAAASTAEAVRLVAAQDGPWVALGTRLAAELHGCTVLREGVEDVAGNETRFVWLMGAGGEVTSSRDGAPGKTSIVFWGAGSDASGWLVRCLSEFARRGVNLTRIESRPRREGFGHYMFFVDIDGWEHDDAVRAGIEGVAAHVGHLSVLGSYEAA